MVHTFFRIQSRAKFSYLLFAAVFLLGLVGRASAADTTYVRFNTILGPIDVQMLSDEEPNTVANFLSYVTSKAYNASIIHRSTSIAVDGIAVIQGGSYYDNVNLSAINTGAPINNEFTGISNLRGTLTMALLTGEPDSATSGWFFNTTDNSAALDPQDFVVFGRVANSASLAVMDALQAIPVPNPPLFNSPFDEIPLFDYTTGNGVLLSNLVEVDSVVTEALPATATVTLSGLSAMFNATAKKITVTTNPPKLTTVVTYNGLLTPPTKAGSYPVSATITSAGYQGSATGTLVIAAANPKLKATVKLGSLTAVYTGYPHGAVAATTPPGLTVDFTYNGSSTQPTAIGTYTVVGTINDPDYQGSATGTLVVGKGTAQVTLGSLTQTFTGSPLSATAVTSPSGLTVDFTYKGSSTPPTAAGYYPVVGTINDVDYNGSATGTFVIQNATITLGNLTSTYDGTAHPATVVTNPVGLKPTVTYNGKATVPLNAGTYDVLATIDSGGMFARSTATLTVSPETATVTVANVTTVYTGKAIPVSAVTVPAKLPVKFTYNGSTTDPSAVGTYTAVGTISNPNYAGSGTGTLTIQQPVTFDTTHLITPLISASGAEVGFGVNPGGIATSAIFLYGTSLGNLTLQSQELKIGAGKTELTFNGFLGDLLPSTTYYYQIGTVSAAGVFYGPVETFTTPAFDTSLVTVTGGTANGTSGATYDVLGNSAVNDGDGVAFGATLNLHSSNPVITATDNAGIWANQGNSTLVLIARTGAAAPDTTPSATFAALKDPVYNDLSDVAFIGQLKVAAGQATATTETGVWSTGSGALHLVARQGDPAPGPSSLVLSTFSTIDAVGLTSAGSADTIVVANMAATGGVTAADNFGIWEGTLKSNLALKMRTGDTVGGKTISSLTLVSSNPALQGQTRYFSSSTGDLAALATFSDKSTGIVTDIGGTEALAESTASPVPDSTGVAIGGATFSKFGSPIINTATTEHIAFAATLATGGAVTTANDQGIWADSSTGTLELVARTGQTGTEFLTLSDPLDNAHDVVAYSATYVSGGKTVTGLFSINTPGGPVVQTGGAAADCGSGVTYSAFGVMELADAGGHGGTGGLVFEATLAGTGVTASNNTAIFAVDSTGTVQLIVRTGDTINVASSGTTLKTISSLSFLPAASFLEGQTRSVARSQDIAYTATFTDKTSAVFNVTF